MTRIDRLPPAARFTVEGLPQLAGTLLSVNESRAHVRYDAPPRGKWIPLKNGDLVRIVCREHRVTDIAPATEVQPLNDQEPPR